MATSIKNNFHVFKQPDNVKIPELHTIKFEESNSDNFRQPLNSRRKILFVFCILFGLTGYLVPMVFTELIIEYNDHLFIGCFIYSSGSVLLLLSIIFLWGPYQYFKRCLTPTGLFLNLTYAISGWATIYCAQKFYNYTWTRIFGVIQIICFIWFVIANISKAKLFVFRVLSIISDKLDGLMPTTQ